jgi:hypothetical protein
MRSPGLPARRRLSAHTFIAANSFASPQSTRTKVAVALLPSQPAAPQPAAGKYEDGYDKVPDTIRPTEAEAAIRHFSRAAARSVREQSAPRKR